MGKKLSKKPPPKEDEKAALNTMVDKMFEQFKNIDDKIGKMEGELRQLRNEAAKTSERVEDVQRTVDDMKSIPVAGTGGKSKEGLCQLEGRVAVLESSLQKSLVQLYSARATIPTINKCAAVIPTDSSSSSSSTSLSVASWVTAEIQREARAPPPTGGNVDDVLDADELAVTHSEPVPGDNPIISDIDDEESTVYQTASQPAPSPQMPDIDYPHLLEDVPIEEEEASSPSEPPPLLPPPPPPPPPPSLALGSSQRRTMGRGADTDADKGPDRRTVMTATEAFAALSGAEAKGSDGLSRGAPEVVDSASRQSLSAEGGRWSSAISWPQRPPFLDIPLGTDGRRARSISEVIEGRKTLLSRRRSPFNRADRDGKPRETKNIGGRVDPVRKIEPQKVTGNEVIVSVNPPSSIFGMSYETLGESNTVAPKDTPNTTLETSTPERNGNTSSASAKCSRKTPADERKLPKVDEEDTIPILQPRDSLITVLSGQVMQQKSGSMESLSSLKMTQPLQRKTEDYQNEEENEVQKGRESGKKNVIFQGAVVMGSASSLPAENDASRPGSFTEKRWTLKTFAGPPPQLPTDDDLEAPWERLRSSKRISLPLEGSQWGWKPLDAPRASASEGNTRDTSAREGKQWRGTFEGGGERKADNLRPEVSLQEETESLTNSVNEDSTRSSPYSRFDQRLGNRVRAKMNEALITTAAAPIDLRKSVHSHRSIGSDHRLRIGKSLESLVVSAPARAAARRGEMFPEEKRALKITKMEENAEAWVVGPPTTTSEHRAIRETLESMDSRVSTPSEISVNAPHLSIPADSPWDLKGQSNKSHASHRHDTPYPSVILRQKSAGRSADLQAGDQSDETRTEVADDGSVTTRSLSTTDSESSWKAWVDHSPKMEAPRPKSSLKRGAAPGPALSSQGISERRPMKSVQRPLEKVKDEAHARAASREVYHPTTGSRYAARRSTTTSARSVDSSRSAASGQSMRTIFFRHVDTPFASILQPRVQRIPPGAQQFQHVTMPFGTTGLSGFHSSPQGVSAATAPQISQQSSSSETASETVWMVQWPDRGSPASSNTLKTIFVKKSPRVPSATLSRLPTQPAISYRSLSAPPTVQSIPQRDQTRRWSTSTATGFERRPSSSSTPFTAGTTPRSSYSGRSPNRHLSSDFREHLAQQPSFIIPTRRGSRISEAAQSSYMIITPIAPHMPSPSNITEATDASVPFMIPVRPDHGRCSQNQQSFDASINQRSVIEILVPSNVGSISNPGSLAASTETTRVTIPLPGVQYLSIPETDIKEIRQSLGSITIFPEEEQLVFMTNQGAKAAPSNTPVWRTQEDLPFGIATEMDSDSGEDLENTPTIQESEESTITEPRESRRREMLEEVAKRLKSSSLNKSHEGQKESRSAEPRKRYVDEETIMPTRVRSTIPMVRRSGLRSLRGNGIPAADGESSRIPQGFVLMPIDEATKAPSGDEESESNSIMPTRARPTIHIAKRGGLRSVRESDIPVADGESSAIPQGFVLMPIGEATGAQRGSVNFRSFQTETSTSRPERETDSAPSSEARTQKMIKSSNQKKYAPLFKESTGEKTMASQPPGSRPMMEANQRIQSSKKDIERSRPLSPTRPLSPNYSPQNMKPDVSQRNESYKEGRRPRNAARTESLSSTGSPHKISTNHSERVYPEAMIEDEVESRPMQPRETLIRKREPSHPVTHELPSSDMNSQAKGPAKSGTKRTSFREDLPDKRRTLNSHHKMPQSYSLSTSVDKKTATNRSDTLKAPMEEDAVSGTSTASYEPSVHERQRGALITAPHRSHAASASETEYLLDAVKRGDVDEVNQLLDEGWDIESHDRFGNRPLHWAARHGRSEMLAYLLRRGAEKDARGLSGWTALHFAAAGGHAYCISILLKAGANPNIRDMSGMTPLRLAQESKCMPVLLELARGGVQPRNQQKNLASLRMSSNM